MVKNRPFTKGFAAILAMAIIRSSTAMAVTAVPGSLAVLEPSITSPEMRSAWDGVRTGIYLDPLLLTKGREEVMGKLEEWGFESSSIRSAYQTADRITLDRTRAMMDQAWALYYRFEYEQAAGVLEEAKELLAAPGDSGFRAGLMFEVLILSGMTARAAGDSDYAEAFMLAAALDPERDLSSSQYSPTTIALYDRLKSEMSTVDTVPLTLAGKPADAVIRLDGKALSMEEQKGGYLVRPGKHFLGASAPGYEPWNRVLEVERFEAAGATFDLSPVGPEGDPHAFFLGRLKEGDVSYLVRLAEKLEVDYLLIPDPHGKKLQAWLIDRAGMTVDHTVLWEAGEPREKAATRAWALVQPLRQHLDRNRVSEGAPLTLPELDAVLPHDAGAGDDSPAWKKYAVAIGVILLVGAVSASDGGGGTRVEATW